MQQQLLLQHHQQEQQSLQVPHELMDPGQWLCMRMDIEAVFDSIDQLDGRQIGLADILGEDVLGGGLATAADTAPHTTGARL